MAKRIILEHTKLPLAGLRQILGWIENSDVPPIYICDVDFVDHRGSCKLVRTKDRYHLYKEVE